MSNVKLSVVIPSYKDPLLIPTINSFLTTSELKDQLEIIAVFDGYWPDFELVDDPRVRYIHLGRNRGMRDAINAGVSVANGEFICRSDEHIMVAPGFDKAMIEVCKANWIMTARRFFLDPIKWEIMDMPPIEHEKLVIQGGVKFAGQKWPERDRQKRHKMLSGTMAMQGSLWIMPKKWWETVIGELQTEGYGPLTQDSHEMVFKTWKANGHLILNKNTWFAHKHRSFKRTHNNGTKENPANTDKSGAYCLEIWRDYYEKEIRPKWGI
jgi:glycosyltransferase involved in cell wall biosynthesis